MKIQVNYKSDLVYLASDEEGNKIRIDMSKEGRSGMTPTQLLLSGVGACSAVDTVIILKKKRKTVIDFQVEVKGKRKDKHPKYFTHIHCKYTLISPDTSLQELQNVAQKVLDKYCSVVSSLKTPIGIECIVLSE